MEHKMVRRTFLVWQSDKEKQWLESMAREGYVLEKVSFMKYVFKKTDPVDLVYDFDFQILNKISEPEYLDLFRDWNFVGKFGSWYYFSKIREGKSKDKIYNDKKSKGEMIKKLIIALLVIGFPLYYQLVIQFPNMNSSEFEYPSFYFFFRIIVSIIFILHTYAVINVLLIYRTFNNSIEE